MVNKFLIFWKKITWIYVRFIQKILINIFLTMTYILVFPFLWLFHYLFTKEKLLNKFKTMPSYWKPCNTINSDIDNYLNQS